MNAINNILSCHKYKQRESFITYDFDLRLYIDIRAFDQIDWVEDLEKKLRLQPVFYNSCRSQGFYNF